MAVTSGHALSHYDKQLPQRPFKGSVRPDPVEGRICFHKMDMGIHCLGSIDVLIAERHVIQGRKIPFECFQIAAEKRVMEMSLYKGEYPDSRRQGSLIPQCKKRFA